MFKWRGHDMNSNGLSDPETSAIVWTSPAYTTEAIKYTGTLSARFLVEGGYSQNRFSYDLGMQPGIQKSRNDPAWYTTPSRSVTGLGTQDAAPPLGGLVGGSGFNDTTSRVLQGSASYVTGMHHAKVGAQWKNGQFLFGGDGNGDMTQAYPTGTRAPINRNIIFPSTVLLATNPTLFASQFPQYTTGSPCNPTTGSSLCSATIYNTPRLRQESLNADFAVFAQDSFTLKRLTVNAGIRYETLNSQIDAMTAGAGRFVPERHVDDRKDLPNWKDWAPRAQIVYDLFGDSKTAIKYSINRYNEAQTVSVAQALNGLTPVTATRTWTDQNNDDIAQAFVTYDPTTVSAANPSGRVYCVYLSAGCEVNFGAITGQTALSQTFGLVSDPGTYIPFPRRYRIEHGLEIQHALLPRVSVSGTYYHGVNKNLTKTVNRGRTDNGTLGTQYAAVNLFNPLDGTPYLYYNTTVTIPTDNLTYLGAAHKIRLR